MLTASCSTAQRQTCLNKPLNVLQQPHLFPRRSNYPLKTSEEWMGVLFSPESPLTADDVYVNEQRDLSDLTTHTSWRSISAREVSDTVKVWWHSAASFITDLSSCWHFLSSLQHRVSEGLSQTPCARVTQPSAEEFDLWDPQPQCHSEKIKEKIWCFTCTFIIFHI